MSQEEDRNRRKFKRSTTLAFMRKGQPKQEKKNRLYKSDHCCNLDHCNGLEFLHHLKTTV